MAHLYLIVSGTHSFHLDTVEEITSKDERKGIPRGE